MPDPTGDAPDTSDRSLLQRLRRGEESAATALYLRYARRLLALAQARTSSDLAAKEEADDIVQSVFKSFFRKASAGLYDVPAGEELWNLLLVITINKIRAKGNYHRAAKRDMRLAAGEEPPTAEKPILFSEKEGKIAWANRRKDPLYLFAALQRHLGYPAVPRPKRPDESINLLPLLNVQVQRLEARIKLLEEEGRGGIDITKFYSKSGALLSNVPPPDDLSMS